MIGREKYRIVYTWEQDKDSSVVFRSDTKVKIRKENIEKK
jgi:uncharacterized protein YndB with AHSA1/START domain